MVIRHVTDLPLVGDNLAVNLVNTVNGPRDGEPTEDFLKTPADLVAWVRHAGAQEGRGDEATLHDVKRLRAAAYAVLRATAERREPPADALAELAAIHAAALSRARLVADGRHFDLAWDGDLVGLLADATMDLLRHGPLDRLKLCDGCPWLFLDTSRNHSRRWCTMDECGSRTKMRRYRARRRATADRRSGSGSSA